jgi:hypothetical protein
VFSRKDDSKTKADAFFYGNVSAQRSHITRYVFKASFFFLLIHDMIFRFHYAKYLALCKSKNVEAKARPPTDWGKNLKKTQTLDGFVVAVKRAPPPVTKAGIKEYLLELIVDADLVRFVDHFFF